MELLLGLSSVAAKMPYTQADEPQEQRQGQRLELDQHHRQNQPQQHRWHNDHHWHPRQDVYGAAATMDSSQSQVAAWRRGTTDLAADPMAMASTLGKRAYDPFACTLLPPAADSRLLQLEIEEEARRRSLSFSHHAVSSQLDSFVGRDFLLRRDSLLGGGGSYLGYDGLPTGYQRASSLRAHPSLEDPIVGASTQSSSDRVVRPRAAEARACADLLEAERRRLSASAELRRQERLLFRESLFREEIARRAAERAAAAQAQLLQDQTVPALAAPGALGGGSALPSSLVAEDMTAVAEYARAMGRRSEIAAGQQTENNAQPSSAAVWESVRPSIIKAEQAESQIAAGQRAQTVLVSVPRVHDEFPSASHPHLADAEDLVASEEPDSNYAAKAPHEHNTIFLPTDSRFLTEAQCYLRSVCIEFFISTEEHVRAPCKGARPSRAGQVGFRCIYCCDKPRSRQANQAICYPSKRENILESMRNFQRVHLNACMYIPDDIKERYASLAKKGQGPKRSQKLVRAYHAQAAAEVGLIDTPRGLDYKCDRDSRKGARGGAPSEEMLCILRAADAEEKSGRAAPDHILAAVLGGGKDSEEADINEDVKYGKFDSVSSDETRRVLDVARTQTTPFVLPSDFPTVSDYLYLLFHQLLPCRPTTATVKRRKLDPNQIGRIPGMCCRHCCRNHGINGMYFSLSVDSLGDSSFSQTLGLHLASCHYVPMDIKNALEELKVLMKEYNVCAKRGTKKAFAQNVWKRMMSVKVGACNVEKDDDDGKE